MCGEKVNKATEMIALRVQMAYLTIELIDKIQEGSHYNNYYSHPPKWDNLFDFIYLLMLSLVDLSQK